MMKRFLLALVFFTGVIFPALSFAEAPASQGVRWLTYNEALKTAKSQQKLIFVDMYADWCVPCRIMDANVYSDSAVASLLNERFLPVKLDADSQEKIVCDGKTKTVQKCYFDVWELKALPAFVLVAPKGLSILTVTQSLTAEEMQDLLLRFLSKEKEWIAR